MPRLPRHEAATIVEEERAWKCETCETFLDVTDKKHCVHCAAYWADVEAGVFDDYDPFEDILGDPS